MSRATRKPNAIGILKAATLGALLGVGGCSSLADGDITKVASTGLGALVGAKPQEQRNAEIELQARSPLVLPPDYKLRPPANQSEEEQQLASDWPEDPDVKAKETAALEEARARAENEKIRKKPGGRAAPLTQEELAAGIVMPSEEPKGPSGRIARVDPSEAVSPEQLLQRHRERLLAEETGSVPQPATGEQAFVVASSQDTTDEAADGVQRQTQEVVEKKAPPPAPKKKSFFDRLIFWK